MNVLLPSFTHCLAVISRCLAIVIILIKIFPIWHWPCVSLAWCLRLRSWRCLDWARSWGDCSVHYLMQPQWPLAPALPALSTCAWLRGPAAAQTRPKRQSSESLKINIYHGGYLSFYKRLGGGCCHAIIIDHHRSLIPKCVRNEEIIFNLFLLKSPCCPRAFWSKI